MAEYSSQARGPGRREHEQLRAEWKPAVESGIVRCRRAEAGQCLEVRDGRSPLIAPGSPWNLGHPDPACSAPTAPEHERCNKATATHYKQAATRQPELHPALRDLL